jgi:TPP-dependent pyruvate/acetoin dehydrogenase alpha subunit
LKVCQEFLVEKSWATPEEIATWRTEAKTEVDAAAAKVQREPSPDPAEEDWRAVSVASMDFSAV